MPKSAPPETAAPPDARTIARAYHETTKHHTHRYARALGYMDWDTQPDPFRRYAGAPVHPLERADITDAPSFAEVLRAEVPPAPPGLASVSRLFYDSLALSAWKQFKESRWSLRVNPSSGNLHPTEGYLVCGPVEGLHDAPAVYHYAPFSHALERRAELPVEVWAALASGLPAGCVLVGLTSIHWRESWKYGERAYRYCQHDVGHAVACVALAAAALGWEARLLAGVREEETARLLGVHGQAGIEAEHPDGLLAVFPGGAPLADEAWRSYAVDAGVRDALAAVPWCGEPNRLSSDHHVWEVIDVVAEACRLDAPPRDAWHPTAQAAPALGGFGSPARRLFHQRRSAVDMDGKSGLSREAFERQMLAVLPEMPAPFGAIPWRPAIHLALFVHRVEDLEPGLYMLVRDPAALPGLREAMDGRFAWARPDGCPPGLALYLLRAADMRGRAAGVSCGQSIAADGAYAVAMIAEFDARLAAHGAWFYRCLHWEAGAIGQVLYLGAEAEGLRATGIGCFFDDATHGLLGLRDTRFQTIYHFTVGAPVEDTRLQTIPAYAHLDVAPVAG